MYGFGLFNSYMYAKAPTGHRWYVGANDDDGTSDVMELTSTTLNIEVNTNINGDLTANEINAYITPSVVITAADHLVIADHSDANKLKTSTITFGTSTTQYLREDGTWGTPAGVDGISGSGVVGQVAVWDGTDSIEGDAKFTFTSASGISTLFMYDYVAPRIELFRTAVNHSFLRIEASNNYTSFKSQLTSTNTSPIDMRFYIGNTLALTIDETNITTSGGIKAALASAAGSTYVRYDSSTDVLSYSTSDIRLKDNIRNWEYDSLTFLRQTPLKIYDRKDGSYFDEIGWIAQDVEKINPNMVCKDKQNNLIIKEPLFLHHFHNSIVQLSETVETNKQKIERLEREVERLKKLNT